MGLNFHIVLIVVHRGHLWYFGGRCDDAAPTCDISAAALMLQRPHVIFWRPLWRFSCRCDISTAALTLQRPLVIFRRTLMMISCLNKSVCGITFYSRSSFPPVWCKCLTTSIQSQPRDRSLSSPPLSHILLFWFSSFVPFSPSLFLDPPPRRRPVWSSPPCRSTTR